jgi:hypothetical protein
MPAVTDPVRLVRFVNYLFGRPPKLDAWWAMTRWRDPVEVQQSREMQTEYRLMGIAFIIMSAAWFWHLIRRA